MCCAVCVVVFFECECVCVCVVVCVVVCVAGWSGCVRWWEGGSGGVPVGGGRCVVSKNKNPT